MLQPTALALFQVFHWTWSLTLLLHRVLSAFGGVHLSALDAPQSQVTKFLTESISVKITTLPLTTSSLITTIIYLLLVQLETQLLFISWFLDCQTVCQSFQANPTVSSCVPKTQMAMVLTHSPSLLLLWLPHKLLQTLEFKWLVATWPSCHGLCPTPELITLLASRFTSLIQEQTENSKLRAGSRTNWIPTASLCSVIWESLPLISRLVTLSKSRSLPRVCRVTL